MSTGPTPIGEGAQSTSVPSAISSPWPGFLDRLDTDPARAWEEFYRFAFQLLVIRPPKPLRRLDSSTREDRIQELVLFFCEDDFRVLRRYRDVGKPFAAWFLVVARNRLIDLSRPTGREMVRDAAAWTRLRDPGPGPQEVASDNEMLRLVRAAAERLGQPCRLLLVGNILDGLKPAELTVLLGRPRGDNKKIADQLRKCKLRLRELLRQAGLSPERLASGSLSAPEVGRGER